MKVPGWAVVVGVVVAVGVAGVLAWRATELEPDAAERARVRRERLLRQEERIKRLTPPVEIPATEAGFNEQKLDFWRRHTVERYLGQGKRDPAWDDDAQELLDMLARWLAHTWEEPEPEEMLPPAERLIEAGCDDFIVATGIAHALLLSGRAQEAKQYADIMTDRTVVDEVRTDAQGRQRPVAHVEDPGSEFVAAWAWMLRGRAAQVTYEPMLSAATPYDLGIPQVLLAMRREELQPGDERVVYDLMQWLLDCWLREEALDVIRNLDQWTGVDLWFRHTLLGAAELSAGWNSRGTGWAYQVTERGWRGLEEHLAKAREHLTRACELRPEYPEAPALMISVVLAEGGGSGESLRDWLDRSVKCQFDYPGSWGRVSNALMPRWGGSHEAMYAFGRECLQTGRFDTRVPEQIFLIAQRIAEDPIEDRPGFWREPGVYEDMVTLFEGQLAEPDCPAAEEFVRTLWAAIAWRAGRDEEALRQMDQARHGDFAHLFTVYFGTTLERARGDLLVRTSPQAERLGAALLLGEEDPRRGASALESLLGVFSDLDARLWVRGKILGLRLREALAGEQWHDITPRPGLAGWRLLRGKWEAGEDGTVTAYHDHDGTLIALDEPVECNFEMRGKLLLPGEPWAAIGGAYFDCRATTPYHTRGNWLIASGLGSTTIYGSNIPQPIYTDVSLVEENAFLVQVWDDMVACYFNGKPLREGVQLVAVEPTRGARCVGLGTADEGLYGLAARYRDIQIRSLTSPPEWVGSAGEIERGEDDAPAPSEASPGEGADA